MAVVINRKNVSAVIHVTANATINVAGNTTTSDIAMPGETISGAAITQAWSGASGNAYWKVARGNTTVLVLGSTGQYDYAGRGCSLVLGEDEDITITLEGTGEGYLVLDLQKNLTNLVTEY